MIINNIHNFISLIKNYSPKFKYINKDIIFITYNKKILIILDFLQKNGYINYQYNPYDYKIVITYLNVKNIYLISKPGRNLFSNTSPYNLSYGKYFLLDSTFPKNSKELLFYVE